MTVVAFTWIAPNYNNTVRTASAAGARHAQTLWAFQGRSLDPLQRNGAVVARGFPVLPAAGGRTFGTGPHSQAAPTNIPVPPSVAFFYTGTGIPQNGGATRMAGKML